MEYYQSPVPCKMCGATYTLPRKYEDTNLMVRDYCFDCYCIKIADIEYDREEQRYEENIKEEVDSNI